MTRVAVRKILRKWAQAYIEQVSKNYETESSALEERDDVIGYFDAMRPPKSEPL